MVPASTPTGPTEETLYKIQTASVSMWLKTGYDFLNILYGVGLLVLTGIAYYVVRLIRRGDRKNKS